MLTVYKYLVPLTADFSLELPMGAQILTFQAQRETPCIWALVDPDARDSKRRFLLVETAYPIEQNAGALRYVGSAQFRGGSLVGGLVVQENDEIMAIKTSGQIIRSSVSEVPVKGRDTMGVKFVSVAADYSVAVIAPYPENGPVE